MSRKYRRTSDTNRTCNKCDEEKSLDMYPKDKNRKLGRGYTCKSCSSAAGSIWAILNPERALANNKRWTDTHPDHVKARAHWGDIRRQYGLTREQWEKLFAEQGGCCACCATDEPGTVRGWHTDHNHKNGQVRGILCGPCNLMLGHAKDLPSRLRAGVTYLRSRP